MGLRNCTVFFLLAVLLAARLLDVHFHLPPRGAAEPAHVVALTLLQPHSHHGEPDHGHIAGHLYEGETDEEQGAGLLAKIASLGIALLLPMLFCVCLLTRPRAVAAPIAAPYDGPPPRTRQRAHLAPPSQAPPLLA